MLFFWNYVFALIGVFLDVIGDDDKYFTDIWANIDQYSCRPDP